MKPERIEEVFSLLTTVENLPPDDAAGMSSGTAMRITNYLKWGTATVQTCLRMLGEQNRAHIHRWTRRSKTWSPVWVLGPGKNAPKPGAITQDEVNARKREQRRLAGCRSLGPYAKRQDRDAQIRSRSREQTEATIEGARRQPRQWFSWLGTAAETVES